MLLDQIYLLSPEEQEAILDGPVLSPPSGVVPELENPPNRNPAALAVIVILLVVGTLAISLRIYSRIVITRKLFLEDFLAFVAYVLFVTSQCLGIRLLHGVGMFVHQWNVRVRDLSEFHWVTTLCLAFYSIVIMNLKVAILLEWTRIFVPQGTRGFFYWTCYVLILINILFYTSVFIVANLSCTPHEKIWDQTLPGKCFDRKTIDVSAASINIASHTLILILPHTVIWKLNMTTRRKISISLVFAIGVLAFISGIFRLIVTIQYFQTQDTTYAISRMALWCGAEMVLVLLVFCAPTFPSVFREMKLLPTCLFASWGKCFRLPSSTDSRIKKTRSNHMLPKFNNLYERVNEDAISPHNPSFQREVVIDSPTRYQIPYNEQRHVSLELGILRTI